MARRDDDLEREIRQHLELEAEDRQADGLSPEEARLEALRAFGNLATTREDARAVWVPLWLQQAIQDLQYAWRVARRGPGFTVGAVLIFALGIGASTTIFGALEAIVLAPMPYPRPAELTQLTRTHAARGLDRFSVSLPLYRDWRSRSSSFSGMAARRDGSVTLRSDLSGAPRQLDASWITHDYLALFGVEPVLGRGILPENDVPGAAPVLVLSHGLWRSAFGADPNVIGRPLLIDGHAHRVVGVAAPDPLRPDDRVFLPLVPSTEDRRGQSDLDVYARLKPDVPIARAEQEMAAIAQALGREHPETDGGWSVAVRPFADVVVGTATPRVLYLLFASVALLLLIACANLAGLLIVRGLGRTQEMAIRAALGGGRGRILRQVITETLFLALAGGALGLAFSYWGMRGLRVLLPPDLPRLTEMGVDPLVLGFAIAGSVATGLLAGLPPARHMARLDVVRGLGDGSRSVEAGGRARGALVIGQIALSMVLLAAAGLTVRTLVHLQRVDLGFSPDRVLTMQIAPRSNPESFIASLLARVRTIPEVTAAGAVSGVPMSGSNLSLHVFPVGPARLAPSESLQADWRIVSDGYFAAMETPILAGRDVTPRDDAGGAKVIVVNETLARLMWGDGDPVGRQLDLGGGGGEPATVVGLVADMRHHDPVIAPAPAYYVPAARGVWGGMTLAIRTAVTSDQIAARVRAEVARLDPALPVFDIRPLDAFVRARTAPQRLTAVTLLAFGAFAVLLAGLGLYALLAHSARQRRREHAIRLAFGATPADLRRAALLDGGRLVLAGLTLGLAATIVVTRVIHSLLAGISPTDPVALLGAAAVLASVAGLACWLPAHRAARVDPAVALRSS